ANHAGLLARGEAPAFQLAYNSVSAGPVAEAMERRLADGKGPRGPWLMLQCRPEPVPAPACLRTLHGHQGAVMAVALTPDARRALSGGADQGVRCWDLETGACLKVLAGNGRDVAAVDLAPDGRWGVSGGGDHLVRFWDLESGQCLRELAGHTNRVRAVA